MAGHAGAAAPLVVDDEPESLVDGDESGFVDAEVVDDDFPRLSVL